MNHFDYKIIYFAYGLIIPFLITFFLIPLVNKIGLYFSIFDIPDKRKLHNYALVRIGGVSFVISQIIFFLSLRFFEKIPEINYLGLNLNLYIFVIIAFFLVGLSDDFLNLSPLKRLIFQILISSLSWLYGIRIDNFETLLSNNFIDLSGLSLLLSFVISVVWIVGITNAFNWLDGLDGLAAGVGVIISFGLLVLNITNGQIILGLISISILGICLGFIPHNFFPASILMGDGGSYFLGSNLSLLSILTYSNTNLENPYIVILALCAFPLLDMTFVIFSRLINKRSPFYPDKSHFHHKLLNIGFAHKSAVFQIYLLNLFFLVLSLYFAKIDVSSGLLIIIILGSIFYFFYHKLFRK